MTELQLEFIQKFGRKELTEGCIFSTEKDLCEKFYKVISFWWDWNIADVLQIWGNNSTWRIHGTSLDWIEILGHPVHWEDVFAKFEENKMWLYSLDQDVLDIQWKIIECDPCKSPMLQPELIEQLLLLIK